MVLQDKASCMSAACLNPAVDDVVVDGCAAPGNKTSHLAAIMSDKARLSSSGRMSGSVDAFEVHQSRFTLLTRMLSQKGIHVTVDCTTRCHPQLGAVKGGAVSVTAHHASFLSLKGDDGLGRRVTAVLLDPTCSGSGMRHSLDAYYKGRHREAQQTTKSSEVGDRTTQQLRQGKKRERAEMAGKQQNEERETAEVTSAAADDGIDEQEEASSGRSQSLSALSAFQTSLLMHAFTLPSLTHIVYSTCSHHTEENEAVIATSLAHNGRARGWEVEAGLLPQWRRRGRRSAVVGLSDVECERMVRCEADEDCMNGFFVCGLVRRTSKSLTEADMAAEQLKGTTTAMVGEEQHMHAIDRTVNGGGERVDRGESIDTAKKQTKVKKRKNKRRKFATLSAS